MKLSIIALLGISSVAKASWMNPQQYNPQTYSSLMAMQPPEQQRNQQNMMNMLGQVPNMLGSLFNAAGGGGNQPPNNYNMGGQPMAGTNMNMPGMGQPAMQSQPWMMGQGQPSNMGGYMNGFPSNGGPYMGANMNVPSWGGGMPMGNYYNNMMRSPNQMMSPFGNMNQPRGFRNNRPGQRRLPGRQNRRCKCQCPNKSRRNPLRRMVNRARRTAGNLIDSGLGNSRRNNMGFDFN